MALTTLVASLLLGSSAQATAIPSYGWKDGDSVTYGVKAKADIQPYTIGGKLTLKFSTGKSSGLWMMGITHEVELIAGDEKAAGPTQPSMWEVNSYLLPTGTGEGANQFGEQLMAILVMPPKAEERVPILGGQALFVSKAVKEGELIKVSSTVKTPSGESAIDRFLDAKTLKLVKGKCVTTSALGKITYELLPLKN